MAKHGKKYLEAAKLVEADDARAGRRSDIRPDDGPLFSAYAGSGRPRT